MSAPVDPVLPTKKSRWPTNKWIVARIAALAGLATMLLTGDPTVVDAEKIAIIAFVSEAGVAYFTRNEATPEGVPLKKGAQD